MIATDRRRLVEMMQGYRLTQILYVAARLGLADHLRDEPRTSEELAAATRTHEPSLGRVLRALAVAGVVREQPGRRFALTEAGALLCDGPGSLRARTIHHGSQLYVNWSDLLHTVRTGETVYQHRLGTSAWDLRRREADVSAIFDESMQEAAAERADWLVRAYDFASVGTLVDVGGGRGSLIAAILAVHPAMRGTLFDQPGVVTSAPEVLAAAGVADRCEVIAGSFFESVPHGGDAYLLSVVIHDWDDDSARVILRNVRRAMSPRGRLLLLERVLGCEGTSLDDYLSDLNMMSQLGGRERSEAEFRALLAAAGFRLHRVLSTGDAMSVLEASPAEAPSRA
jgi:hypothetical protein